MQLFPWQREALDLACRVDELDHFTSHSVTLVAPRRNGKTQLVLARILAGIILWDEREVLYTAHDGPTATETWRALTKLITDSPLMAAEVEAVYRGVGTQSIRFRHPSRRPADVGKGPRFSVRTRTGSGGRGLECDLLILDEGLQLTADQTAALTPLVGKATARGRGQIWTLSSAGRDTSAILAGMRDHGRAVALGDVDDPEVTYIEHAAPRDADPTDPETWRLANPSLGTSILTESFLAAQLGRLDSESFGREHLGWWTGQRADPFLPHGSWDACRAVTLPQLDDSSRVVLGVELQSYTTTARLIAAAETPTGAYVQLVDAWDDPNGLDEAQLAQLIRDRWRQTRAQLVACDAYTCRALADHLVALGVPVRRLDLPGVRAASQTLLAAVTSRRLTHQGSPVVDVEVVNAGKAVTGDGLTRLSRRTSTGSSASAFATAAAVSVLLEPAPLAPRVHTLATR